MSTFPASIAITFDGVKAPPGTVGQVFAATDTAAASPLPIFDLSGLPLAGDELIATDDSIIPWFRCDGYTTVDWVSGDFRIPIPCIDQVPAGGSSGQVLAKTSGTDYDTGWVDPPVGGGDPGASSFDELSGLLSPDQSASGACMFVYRLTNATPWGARPTNRPDVVVFWIGPDPDPTGVDSGTGGMLNNKDIRIVPQ